MELKYKKVNIDEWKRKEHFSVYRNQTKCGFSLTVKLKIASVVRFVKANEYKFYPVMIYLITKVVNRYQEFRMALKDDDLIIWDEVIPVYTVLHKESETFSALFTTETSTFDKFLASYDEVVEKHRGNFSFLPEKPPANHFNISAIPWIFFDSFNLNIADFTDYFTPSFTIGKYQQEGEEIVLPVAVQVHHATCDGIHVG
ncbi:CatA-like O-acetyltransferase [Daejeonia sp. YH14]|uniref:CatA-like O-acetyltransferase n=1 Tax=Daejeonia sp. YH14 TaxID=3439042 RepID=UPI003F4997E0